MPHRPPKTPPRRWARKRGGKKPPQLARGAALLCGVGKSLPVRRASHGGIEVTRARIDDGKELRLQTHTAPVSLSLFYFLPAVAHGGPPSAAGGSCSGTSIIAVVCRHLKRTGRGPHVPQLDMASPSVNVGDPAGFGNSDLPPTTGGGGNKPNRQKNLTSGISLIPGWAPSHWLARDAPAGDGNSVASVCVVSVAMEGVTLASWSE